MSHLNRSTVEIEIPHGEGDSIPSKRDYKKCQQCRKGRQKCVWKQPFAPGAICERCHQKGWGCSDRARAPPLSPTHTSQDPFIEESLIILTVCLLLSSCRYACQSLRCMIDPWPYSGLYGHTSIVWPKSSSLRQDNHRFSGLLALQIEALDKVERAVLSYQKSCWANRTQGPRRGVGGIGPILACIFAISPGGWYPPVTHQGDTFAERGSVSAERYVWLARRVRRLLQTQFSCLGNLLAADGRPLIPISNAFPPSHIAYWNGAKDSAIELWRRSMGPWWLDPPRTGTYTACPDSTADVLGRTFPQIVAEAGDFETLGNMSAYIRPETIFAKLDARGLSLCALAICAQGMPDPRCLLWLLSQRKWDPLCRNRCEPSLLDLALSSGRQENVRTIVDLKIITESYGRYTKKAIELCRADLAACFVPWLNDQAKINQGEIRELARLADNKYEQLKRELRFAMAMSDNALADDISCKLPAFLELVQHLKGLLVQSPSLQEMSADVSSVNIW